MSKQQTQSHTATSEQIIEHRHIQPTTCALTEPRYPTSSQFWCIVLSLCVVMILGGLHANIVATTLCPASPTTSILLLMSDGTPPHFDFAPGRFNSALRSYINISRSRSFFCCRFDDLKCVESLAIISAPLVGGALTQSLEWRWCFW